MKDQEAVALHGCVYENENVESAKSQIDRLFAKAKAMNQRVAALAFDVLYADVQRKGLAIKELEAYVATTYPGSFEVKIGDLGRSN
jgi:hypothetical protein